MSIIPLILAASLAVTPPCAGHVAPRDYRAKKAFMHMNPCPGGPDRKALTESSPCAK